MPPQGTWQMLLVHITKLLWNEECVTKWLLDKFSGTLRQCSLCSVAADAIMTRL